MNFSELNKAGRLLLLICICIGLYSAMTSGTILIFLHPRTLLLVKIAWAIFLALTLSGIQSFFKSKASSKLDWRLIAIFFPLVLAVSVKPTGLSPRMAVQKGLSSLALNNKMQKRGLLSDQEQLDALFDSLLSDSMADVSYKNQDTVAPADVKTEPYDTSLHDSSLIKSANIYAAANPAGANVTIRPPSHLTTPCVLREDSMYIKVDAIYANPRMHKGRLITMTGFIASDTVLGRNSFFISRMMVTCCAADAMPLGFYCITDSTLGVLENDWVILTGKLEVHSVKLPWDKEKRTMPILRVVSIRKTMKPQNEYVYPFL